MRQRLVDFSAHITIRAGALLQARPIIVTADCARTINTNFLIYNPLNYKHLKILNS